MSDPVRHGPANLQQAKDTFDILRELYLTMLFERPPCCWHGHIEKGSAFLAVCYLDGLGSKDYDTAGLTGAGGEESHKVVEFSLWDLDPTRRDDTYPY